MSTRLRLGTFDVIRRRDMAHLNELIAYLVRLIQICTYHPGVVTQGLF